ncbi:MAG TPA: nuclear transport factor 2 family protein [Chitinophagaceae bacterium]|nr:nuclear transport factor 2 family protein [Chitinophagaceae bacterium]
MNPEKNWQEVLLMKAYDAFNARDMEGVISLMKENITWPNGWEGGYVFGHNGVRDYWKRQWAGLNPKVVPVSFRLLDDGRAEIIIQQTVKDMRDNLLFQGPVKHLYTFEDGLIAHMEIAKM